MAFFGCQVKPNTPYSLGTNPVKGRLRISLASLGMGSSANKSILRCDSRKATPVVVCSLLPEKYETCQLNLEFDEDDDVVFSVIGPRSIHLTGYYVDGVLHHRRLRESSESIGEDIADTEFEGLSDDEGYGGSFINDGDPCEKSKDKVAENPNKPLKDKAGYRRLRKKYQLNDGGSGSTLFGDEDKKKRCGHTHSHTHRVDDYVFDSRNSFVSSSLVKKLIRSNNNKAPDADAEDHQYVSDSESTGSFFFMSSTSLLNKNSKNATKEKESNNRNMDQQLGDSSDDFALQLEHKRESWDESSQESKKRIMERKKRKATLVERAESVGIPLKKESNTKTRKIRERRY